MRPLKALLLLSLGIAVSGTVALAHTSPDAILAFTMSRTVNVSEGETAVFKVACPRGYVATSAGLSRAAHGAYEPEVRPLGTTAYEFGVELSPTVPDRKPTGTVACRKMPLGGGRLKVTTVRTAVSVGPASNVAASLPCPAGTTAVGTGALPRNYTVSLVQASPTPTRASFVVRNFDEVDAQSIVLYGSCIGLHPRRGLRLEVTRTTIRPLVKRGLHTYTRRCPRGSVSLGTGYMKAKPTVLAHAAMPWGGTWTAWVYSRDDPARAKLVLVCGRLRSS